MTDIGKHINKEIKAEDIFRRLLDNLEREIDAMNPVNTYDIQQSAVTIAKKDIEKQLNSEELLKIKDVAYKKRI